MRAQCRLYRDCSAPLGIVTLKYAVSPIIIFFYIDYINVDYTVCGVIESMGEEEIELLDELPLKIVFTNGFVSPNNQTGDYFTVSVIHIKLPWVLDEPFPGAEKKPEHPKCVLKRFFKRYKR